MVAFGIFVALAALTSSLAHPIHDHTARELRIVGSSSSAVVRRQETPAPESPFTALVEGNNAFKAKDPELLKKLTDDGQAPPFMFLGCSDSRASEGTLFSAAPGTLFTQRNIANQFSPSDTNTKSVLAYAVSVLGVQHVIVMGHYGCGGVAAAIASAPTKDVDAANGVVQAWIDPIRELFRSSSRPEIVELRERIKGNTTVEEPEVDEPGFRALVEENVKVGVSRIAADSVIVNHYAALAAQTPVAPALGRRSEPTGPPVDVFIHGWVYDIANGEVRDLGISVGPPGKAIPAAPWPAVASAAEKAAASHETPAAAAASHPAPATSSHDAAAQPLAARCADECKAKRSFWRR